MAQPKLARFEANIHFGRINENDEFLGFFPSIEFDQFQPTREQEDPFTVTSKKRNTYNQTIYSEGGAAQSGFTAIAKEIPEWMVELVFATAASELSQSAASATSEAITIHEIGTYYKLPHENIDASTVTATGEGGTPSLTKDTDFEVVDARVGLVRALEGGAITAGMVVEFSYDYLALSGADFVGETVTEQRFRVFVDAKNRITGKDFRIEYHDVKCTVPDLIDLLSGELSQITIEGIASTPDGETGPYKIRSVA